MSDKFCVNCAHFILASEVMDAREYAKCGFRFPDLEPVLGLPRTQSMSYCANLRTSTNAQDCGPQARYYKDNFNAQELYQQSLSTEGLR